MFLNFNQYFTFFYLFLVLLIFIMIALFIYYCKKPKQQPLSIIKQLKNNLYFSLFFQDKSLSLLKHKQQQVFDNNGTNSGNEKEYSYRITTSNIIILSEEEKVRHERKNFVLSSHERFSSLNLNNASILHRTKTITYINRTHRLQSLVPIEPWKYYELKQSNEILINF